MPTKPRHLILLTACLVGLAVLAGVAWRTGAFDRHDTPAQHKTYLSGAAFPKGTIGLTGAPEQVAVAAKAYHAYCKKNGEGPDYLVDHSTPAYLMDPKGRFDRVLPYGITPEEIARQIGQAMG